jgi:formylglycine-generating enzyme required for sulfatase activity
LQQALKLRNEDVALIETRVIPQRRRFSTAQLLTRQQFLKLAGLGGAGFVVAVVVRAFQSNSPQPVPTPFQLASSDKSLQPTPTPSQLASSCESPQPTPSPSPSQKTTKGGLPLQVFEFDVVTVDARGKEIQRNCKQAKFFSEDLGNWMNLEMVSIPGGKFLMGSPMREPRRQEDERPQHSVTVAAFFMSKFTVTQSQWRVVASFPRVKIDLNPDPSTFEDANLPVEYVSWYDAIEFCERLSKKTRRQYRLPSEAEWEYAARAETTTPFHFGETITSDLANYSGNFSYASGPKGTFRGQTTEVGSFSANAFGLYDMHGNVWEWCEDTWHENYNGAPIDGTAWVDKNDRQSRLLRGGSWRNEPRQCRSANRYKSSPDDKSDEIGFRVVCSVPRTS